MEQETINPNNLDEQQQPNETIDWDKATGRDKYFQVAPNKDIDLVANNWRPYSQGGQEGIMLDVIRVDGVEYAGEKKKLWTTTSKRTVKELEPIIKAAVAKGKAFIHIVFRKSLGSGQKDTDAVFNAKNLDPELNDLLPKDQQAEEQK